MIDFQMLGFNLYTFTFVIFFAILIAISIIDARTMEIPIYLNISIFILGIFSMWTVGGLTILERIIGFFCVSLLMFFIVLAVPGGFGGGDIKLMAAAGFFLGWKLTIVAFFIGLVFGGAYGAILLIGKKKGRKDHFAFGPFLSIGLIAAAIIGNQLLAWYLGAARFYS